MDTLLGLEFGEDEMVSLCWEYMNAAVKTTTTALEWIMARLVLHQVTNLSYRKPKNGCLTMIINLTRL